MPVEIDMPAMGVDARMKCYLLKKPSRQASTSKAGLGEKKEPTAMTAWRSKKKATPKRASAKKEWN